MGTKLYVANLPYAPSTIALRSHFSACGVVSEVEIVSDRNAGRGRDSAFVRMSSAAGAERALSELNGAPFAGQLLLVERAPDDPHTGSAKPRPKAPVNDAATHITLQFREQANMTYELDCAGLALVVRVFFPDTTGQWRVLARESREVDAPDTAAAARSRLEAFRQVARACCEDVRRTALGRVDWTAVEDALVRVRAL